MSPPTTTAAPQSGERPFRSFRPDVVHTAALSVDDRAAIRRLLDIAFDGDFDDVDFDHALGGLHVVVRTDDAIVGHAAVVQRQLLVDGRPVRCGYVEAVAVRPGWGRRGIGGELMATVEEIVGAAYDVGALSASEQGRGLYRRRGWRVWTGELAVVTPQGCRATPDDVGSVMVWGSTMDLGGRLACDWRAGDAW